MYYIYITDTYPGAQPTINGTMATTSDGSSRPGTPSRRGPGPRGMCTTYLHRVPSSRTRTHKNQQVK